MTIEEMIAEMHATTKQAFERMIDSIDADTKSTSIIPALSLSIVSVVSMIADLLEVKYQGASTYFFKEVETGLKLDIVEKIKSFQQEKGGASYSLSDIAPNDFENGMNYLGQALSETLFSTIHELPKSMHTQEMLLRGVEALLANLLHSKFRALGDVHSILDSLCEHVHMNLKALDNKVVPITANT